MRLRVLHLLGRLLCWLTHLGAAPAPAACVRCSRHRCRAGSGCYRRRRGCVAAEAQLALSPNVDPPSVAAAAYPTLCANPLPWLLAVAAYQDPKFSDAYLLRSGAAPAPAPGGYVAAPPPGAAPAPVYQQQLPPQQGGPRYSQPGGGPPPASAGYPPQQQPGGRPPPLGPRPPPGETCAMLRMLAKLPSARFPPPHNRLSWQSCVLIHLW